MCFSGFDLYWNTNGFVSWCKPNAFVNKTVGGKQMKQRDKFRELFRRYGGDEEKIIEAYAVAEERLEVERSRNTHSLSARAYAKALYRDAIRRGWHK
jgi:hypothetical protein